MADFTQSKSYGTAIYPVHAQETSGLMKRCEPFLTPEKLVSRYLKGIPLKFPNGDTFTDDEFKDQIMLAMNEAELLLGTTINREAFKQKIGFDANLYKAFVHLRAERGPIISLEQLAIVSSDGVNLFEIPPTWIESANFSKHVINVIPLLAGYGLNQVTGTSVSGNGGAGGIAFLSVLGGIGWVPAYWEIKYTAGLSNKEGQVPVPVNELIGAIAAINVLGIIGPSNIHNSQSLSQDGISQSSSGLGPRLYERRMDELVEKREMVVKKLKAIFSTRYFVGEF